MDYDSNLPISHDSDNSSRKSGFDQRTFVRLRFVVDFKLHVQLAWVLRSPMRTSNAAGQLESSSFNDFGER